MSDPTKMFLRLTAPAVLVFVFGMALASIAGVLSGLPFLLGGNRVGEGIGNAVALTTAAVSLAIYGAQMVRYWRWTRDEGDLCFVCGCLLGREREGRFGPYRKCLGCGKNHALGRLR